jgi:hypothetical protein
MIIFPSPNENNHEFTTLKTMLTIMMVISQITMHGDNPDGFYFYQDNHIDHVMG